MEIKNAPNVVPLCDILLVLLIIFMVITPMAQVGIDVTLPERGEGPVGRPIVLSIEEDGSFNMNNEKYATMASLENRLRDIFGPRMKKIIFVKAHHVVQYQHLVNTIDTIKKAGIDTVSVIPTPTGGSTQSKPIPIYRNKKI